MKKNLQTMKPILTMGALVLVVYAAIVGNETILPTAMILLLLMLRTFRKSEVQTVSDTSKGKASSYAVTTFALFFASLSVVISLYFPAIAKAMSVDGLYDGEFVRVTINDAHEFCYSICLLLLIEMGYYFVFRNKKVAKLVVQD